MSRSKQQHRSMPARSRIVLYWRDKFISESGEIGLLDDFPQSKSEPIIMDIGEPHCFGCGKFIDPVMMRKDYDDILLTSPFTLWDLPQSRELERCHIIPCALGGTKARSNLFLLCADCHKEAPDTIFRNVFFQWIFERRRKGTKLMYAIKKASEYLMGSVDFDACRDNIPNFFDFVSDHQGSIKGASLCAAIIGHYSEAN